MQALSFASIFAAAAAMGVGAGCAVRKRIARPSTMSYGEILYHLARHCPQNRGRVRGAVMVERFGPKRVCIYLMYLDAQNSPVHDSQGRLYTAKVVSALDNVLSSKLGKDHDLLIVS